MNVEKTSPNQNDLVWKMVKRMRAASTLELHMPSHVLISWSNTPAFLIYYVNLGFIQFSGIFKNRSQVLHWLKKLDYLNRTAKWK